ncbi:MAG: adenylosuccinate synthase, partial [Psychroserpens sp.]
VTPIYTDFKGWAEDLTKMREVSQFPKELNEYIEFLEKELEIPITIVSVGPDRTQTINR